MSSWISGTVIPHGTGRLCQISVGYPALLRVAQSALAVWHHLLRVARPSGLGFFKDNFWASFWAYLHITYKTLNKTN